jgi:large subunit ribosomal protein L24
VIVQTTLLGFAFAIILALLVALIGPFLVDWTQFRSVFEAEASRMVGLPVRVKGTIDARLLPSPSLTLHGLEIGGPKPEQTVQARLLNIEFALGSLMRGELRAVEAQLSGPEVTLAVDQNGSLDLPKLSVGFVPESLSIERLTVEDGRVHAVNAVSGSRTTLDKVWFNGDLRSLAGPFRGEGAFVSGGELYGYRISAGKLEEDGRVRLRLSLDPSDRALTAEAEGALVVGAGRPRFEGTVAVSRPAGLVAATGQSAVKTPWRITSRVHLDAAGAKLERIDFLYGPEEGGLRLTGTADLRLGRQPLLKGVLSARQLDLDRLVATPDRPMRLPIEAVRALIATYSGSLEPPVPTELSISVDSIVLGGASLQLFGADLRLGSDAWTLDRVEFRAPGLSQISFSGRLDLAPFVGFSGPVAVETNEPGALANWLIGYSDPVTQIRPLKARGEIELNQQHIIVEQLKAEIDRKAVQGRLHYTAAALGLPSRLEAELTAPELDVDPLVIFARAAFADGAWRAPDEITLGLATERARIGGVLAKAAQVRLKRDATQFQLERLSIADLDGTNLLATGRIDTSGATPRGNLTFDLEASDLDGVIALAATLAPSAAEPLRRAAGRVPEAKLRVALNLDGPAAPAAGAKTTARFDVEGRLGGLRASLHGEARQDSHKIAGEGVAAFLGSDVRVQAQIDGENGSALLTLLGFDRAVEVDHNPGFVNVRATGRLGDALQAEGSILAGGLDAKASGTVRIAGERGASADLRVDVARANIRPLFGHPAALPLQLRSRVALTEQDAKLTDLAGTLAGTELRGALTLGFASRLSVAGQIEADTLDAAAVVASAIGAPREARPARGGAPASWSTEPYRAGQFADIEGRVDLKVMRATLTPSLPARQLQTALIFRGAEITLDDFEAHVAGGRLAGRLAFRRGKDGLAVRAHVELSKLDAAAVLPSDPRPAIGGKLSAKLDLEAAGLSPKALVGSLAGSGTVTLEDGYFSSLNPTVFDTIIRASDQGLAAGTSKIRDIVSAALNSGRIGIPKIETTITIDAGQVRPANAVVETEGTELAAAGSFDLIQHQMDVRLTLSGPHPGEGASGRPDIFIGLKGPVPSPHRTIDVSALAGWLTIRRIEQQAKKLEALEIAAREQEAARAQARSPAQAPALATAPAPLAAPPGAAAPPSVMPAQPPAALLRPEPRGAAPVAPERPPARQRARAAPEARPASPAFLTPAQPGPLTTPILVAPSVPAPMPTTIVPAAPVTAPAPEPPAASAALPVTAVPAPETPSAREHPAAPTVAPEPGSPASPAVTGAGAPDPLPELAPPLPAPLDIRMIPRGPQRHGSEIEVQPSEPLRLPSSSPPPSLLDTLMSPRR